MAPVKAKLQRHPAPDENDPDEGDADGRGKLGRRVEERRGQAALARGKPCADGLGVRGERGRFAHPEQEPRAKKAAQVGRNGSGKGGHAPQKRSDAPHAANTELIQHHADGQLAQGVGPVIGAGKITKDDIGDAKGRDQGIVRNGKIDAVEVVDQNADAEQPRDAPAAPRQARTLWRVAR